MTYQTFLIYDPDTHEVCGRCGNMADNIAASIPAGRKAIAVDLSSPEATEYDYSQFYVLNDQVLRRRAAKIVLSATTVPADGASELTINNIPENSKLTVSGAVSAGPISITERKVILTFTNPGEITLSIECPVPFTKWEGKIHAT